MIEYQITIETEKPLKLGDGRQEQLIKKLGEFGFNLVRLERLK